MTVRQVEAAANWVLGIDISNHQNEVDWTKIRESGQEFVFLKATEGGDFVDRRFRANWGGSRRAGMLRGAYHFFRPKTAVQLQIDNFVRTVQTITSGDLPPVLDVEDPRLWEGIDKKKAVALILEWCEGVESRLGIRPIIYLSPSFARDIIEADARLTRYPLWLAHYTAADSPRVPAPWTSWTFWQYSETGSVPGISGNVDMNRFNGTRSQLDSMTKQVRALRSTTRRWFWDWFLSMFEW